MVEKIRVTPGGMTLLQAKLGMVVVAFFLLFGLVFGAVVWSETPESEFGLRVAMAAFFLVWTGGCVSCLVIYTRLLSKKQAPENSLVDLTFEKEVADREPEKTDDFESRLRKLAALRQDGLISEQEFQEKRDQILNEKW